MVMTTAFCGAEKPHRVRYSRQLGNDGQLIQVLHLEAGGLHLSLHDLTPADVLNLADDLRAAVRKVAPGITGGIDLCEEIPEPAA